MGRFVEFFVSVVFENHLSMMSRGRLVVVVLVHHFWKVTKLPSDELNILVVQREAEETLGRLEISKCDYEADRIDGSSH